MRVGKKCGAAMRKKDLKKAVEPGNEVMEVHITSYLNKICKVIFYVLLVLLFTEILICALVRMGYFSYYLKFQNNVKLSYSDFVFETISKVVICWAIYGVFMFFYKKADFRLKKFLVCVVLLVLTSIFVFGHWKYSYLSILYSIPVVVTCPLGKKTNRSVLVISILITILYSIFQNLTFNTEYNFLICTVSLTTIVTFYLIAAGFYESMTKALMDVEKFFLLSTKLNDEIAHDDLTGAFSKVTLRQSLIGNKKFNSIAFIDLDNFKEINDTKGHAAGDQILKNMVRCFTMMHESIYRYGGDEFVALSELYLEEFVDEINKIKVSFNTSSKKLFSIDATFSAGVMEIKPSDTMDSLLKKCDQAMYVSKQRGRNTVSIKD